MYDVTNAKVICGCVAFYPNNDKKDYKYIRRTAV